MAARFCTVALIACAVLLTGCAGAVTPAGSAVAAKQVITAPDLPRAVGPYSHAICAGGLLFLASQPGIDPSTGQAPREFAAQTRQALENVARILQASGSGMEHVVRATVFLTDPNLFQEMNRIYAEYFKVNPPVRSTPIVQLPLGLLISVEVTAVAPSGC